MPKVKSKPKPKPPVYLPPSVECLLDNEQVALALGCSDRMLRKEIAAGRFPPPDASIGTLRRWKSATVNAWIRNAKAAAPRTPSGWAAGEGD